jgi:hypothetical protein
MASICIDSNDFKVDPSNGRLQLKPVYYQTPATNFDHLLSGANGVYEQITELNGLTIGVAGIYDLNWTGVGNANNTSTAPGNIVNTSCACAVYQNGVLIPNTETRMMLNSQGSSTVDQPALQLHASGSGHRVIQCAAGDVLTLWAQRNSVGGTDTHILSSGGGRSRISAVRRGSA